MRTMRVMIAAAVVAGALGVSPTSAVAGEGIPVIRGTTIITGDDAAQMRVRLPAPLALRNLGNWDFEITGDGRVIYFLLIKERRDGSVNDNIFVDGYAVGRCAEEACASQTEDTYGGSFEGVGDRDVLPAGRYRLYLVADGAPARIELQFAALSGRTQLSPSEPAVAQVDTITPHVGMLSPPSYFGYSEAPFGGEGVALLSLWFDEALAYGHCVYWKNEQPVAPAAYLPGACGDDTHVVSADQVAAAEGFDWGFSMLMPLPKAVGTWYTSASVFGNAGSIAMWLQTEAN